MVGYIEDVLWCEYLELCLKLCSFVDFIEIVNIYNIVLVSNVLYLIDYFFEGMCCFIYLVDEFYDCGVKLILILEDIIIDLYFGDKLVFEIECMCLCLLEM